MVRVDLDNPDVNLEAFQNREYPSELSNQGRVEEPIEDRDPQTVRFLDGTGDLAVRQDPRHPTREGQ